MRFLAGPVFGRVVLTVLAVASLLILLAACGDGGEKKVTGLVLEAVERSFAEIELIRLRDDAGKVWEFSTQGPVGTSASHLRQHQLGGTKIAVTYLEVGSRLIALEVSDADDHGG